MAESRTGSGKTAAFALPILQRLNEDPYGVFALVLTPTRELAFQLRDQVCALGASMAVRVVVCVGGQDMMPQSLQLTSRPHFIIATPGRLADALRSGVEPHFAHLRFLVLDESDRLLTEQQSFSADLQSILAAVPHADRRQTLLFSATMMRREEVGEERWQQLGLDAAASIRLASDELRLVKRLDQRYLFIPQQVKEAYLLHLLTRSSLSSLSTIVFVPTSRSCALLHQLMLSVEPPLSVTSLHSRLSQHHRTAALQLFRSSARRILVATDVASRGLDLPAVAVVLHFSLPSSAATYVHRVGRTARAGRGGVSVALVSQYEVEVVREIEQAVGSQMREMEGMVEAEVVAGVKAVAVAREMARLRLDEMEESLGRRGETAREKREMERREKGRNSKRRREAAQTTAGLTEKQARHRTV
jgi:ATP-dependent RNA helicase DDX49/DBP8